MNDVIKRVQTVTLASEWASFREQVLHPDSPPQQVTDMRRAFYAGAWLTLTLFRDIGEDEISEEAGVEALERIHQESIAFKADVEAGRA